MKTRLLPTVSALAVLMAGTAFAQQPPASSEPPSAPPMAKPDAMPPAMTQPTPARPAPRAAQATFVDRQSTGERLASEWKGLTVVNSAGDSVGTVKDISIDSEGRIAAVVIGVGGFLGLGERLVAVRHDAITLTPDKEGRQILKLNASEQALDTAPAYMTLKDQKAEADAQIKAIQRGTAPAPQPDGSKK